MNEYQVGDYGLFQDGIFSVNALNDNMTKNVDVLTQCQTQLKNESIFMGPICNSCLEGIGSANLKISNSIEKFTTIANFLKEAAISYKTSDEAAAKNIEHLDTGAVSSNTSSANASPASNASSTNAATSNASSTNSSPASNAVATGNTNQDCIYNYLSGQGFNAAAISGILANIEHESNFDPNALGDRGTSFGICQWHNERWYNMETYCNDHGLKSNTLEGQLAYLVYELQTYYPNVYDKIISVPNTSAGAYTAAYEWTINFEMPYDKYTVAANRGDSAISNYWSVYGQNL